MSSSSSTFRIISSYAESYLGDLKQQSATRDGHAFNYFIGGEGEPVIVIHGLAGSKHQWRPFMYRLKKSHLVIAPDFPGFCPAVPLKSGKYNTRNMKVWFDEFIEFLDIDSFHLVGHSTGGCFAAYYAHQQPEKLKSFAWFNPPDMSSSGGLQIEELEKYKRLLKFDSVESIDSYLEGIFYNVPSVPAAIKRTMLNRFRTYESLLNNVMKDLVKSQPIVIAQLKKIAVNTILICADNDYYTNEKWIGWLLRTLPDAHRYDLHRCGHMSILERPQALAECYTDALKHLA